MELHIGIYSHLVKSRGDTDQDTITKIKDYNITKILHIMLPRSVEQIVPDPYENLIGKFVGSL